MLDEGKLMLWECSIYETICIPAEVQIIVDEASKTSHNSEEVILILPSRGRYYTFYIIYF